MPEMEPKVRVVPEWATQSIRGTEPGEVARVARVCGPTSARATSPSLMIPRQLKAAFYRYTGPAMRANAWRYRTFSAPAAERASRIHLGPGQNNYLAGWINVDANTITARCDVWADLNASLPFRTGTIAAAYSHHVVEHLADLPRHFRDVHRCLRPGGVYRVGVPNADVAIRKFLEHDGSWFGDFPDRRESIGGRLDNFLMCRGEHVAVMTESFLRELLAGAGFTSMEKVAAAAKTNYPQLFDDCLRIESEPDPDAPRTLVCEGVKP